MSRWRLLSCLHFDWCENNEVGCPKTPVPFQAYFPASYSHWIICLYKFSCCHKYPTAQIESHRDWSLLFKLQSEHMQVGCLSKYYIWTWQTLYCSEKTAPVYPFELKSTSWRWIILWFPKFKNSWLSMMHRAMMKKFWKFSVCCGGFFTDWQLQRADEQLIPGPSPPPSYRLPSGFFSVYRMGAFYLARYLTKLAKMAEFAQSATQQWSYPTSAVFTFVTHGHFQVIWTAKYGLFKILSKWYFVLQITCGHLIAKSGVRCGGQDFGTNSGLSGQFVIFWVLNMDEEAEI